MYNDGTMEWLVRGVLHRTDGYAMENKHGYGEYWVRGLRLTEQEFNLYVDQLNGDVLIPPGKPMTYGQFRLGRHHA